MDPKTKVHSICSAEASSSELQSLVGTRISVLWKMMSTRFFGTIQRYDDACRMHLVVYDDGDLRWHSLHSEDARALTSEEEAFGASSKRRSRQPDR